MIHRSLEVGAVEAHLLPRFDDRAYQCWNLLHHFDRRLIQHAETEQNRRSRMRL